MLPSGVTESGSRRRWAMAILAGAALTLAVLATFEPWYAIEDHTHNLPVENVTIAINSTTTFYVGSDYRFLCSTYPTSAPIWGPICRITQMQPGGVLQPYYALNPVPIGGGSSSVGSLYSTVASTTALSVIGAGIALALLVLDGPLRVSSRRLRWPVAVALLAVAALTLGTALGVAALQPAALVHDAQSAGNSNTVTGSTFWGSCGPSMTPCAPPFRNVTDSRVWGPAFGWYFELAGGAVFAALAVISFRRAIRSRRIGGPSGLPPNPP